MSERDALIIMNQVIGLGAITVRRLEHHFGSLTQALAASVSELQAVAGIGMTRAERFCQEFRRLNARAEVARAAQKGVKLITWYDPGYPAVLQQLSDPPMVLYVAGNVEALNRPAVAIVGTRRASIYGRETARRLSYQLASLGYMIVSGLALGIDTEAHQGALQAKGTTVAVLGGALDCFYPRENKQLARAIVAGGGAIICDYPFGRQPDAQSFPMRNRIVSGLAKGVVVVESPLKSGTMITVNLALEQGRAVMAVPGRVDSPLAQGCHRMIRDGARLVTSADDVLEELQDLVTNMRQVAPVANKQAVAAESAQPRMPLSADERALMCLLESEAQPIDAVVRVSGLEAGKVNALLVGLQIKRLVNLLSGGMVAKRRG